MHARRRSLGGCAAALSRRSKPPKPFAARYGDRRTGNVSRTIRTRRGFRRAGLTGPRILHNQRVRTGRQSVDLEVSTRIRHARIHRRTVLLGEHLGLLTAIPALL